MTMKRFLIERTVPGASQMSEQDFAQISKTSNAAVESLEVPYRWIKSYVAGDKLYCIHEAEDDEAIREHGRRGKFPVDSVTEVAREFGPQTAELLTHA
jgi:hypothetical protein